MGLVIQFNKPGTKFSKMLDKEYQCTKYDNEVSPLNDHGLLTYHCNYCGRLACHPRICYRLNDEYKDRGEVEDMLVDLGFFDGVWYRGKLATVVAVLADFYYGGEGISGRISDFMELAANGKQDIT